MTNITRRAAFAIVPAMGAAAIVPAKTAPIEGFIRPAGAPEIRFGFRSGQTPPDPLLDLIRDYYVQLADFNANAPQGCNDAFDAYADATFNPPMHQIEEWRHPARSFDGAREAIRLALKESEEFSSSDMVPPLLRAALAYLDEEARS